MPTIKYFGLIADITGVHEEQIVLEGNSTVESLQKQLQKKYHELEALHYKIAVNQQLSHAHTLIQQEDEIALLPPFAGG